MSKRSEQPEPVVVHHVPPRKKRAKEPLRMQLNLTSMIDVIFLLLIYFVITASFTADEGVLTTKLPQGTGSASQADLKPPAIPLDIVLRSIEPSSVHITVNNRLTADSFSQLYDLLVSLQKDYPPDNPLLIKPDGQVRWQHVVDAFNAAVRAKFSNVAFAAQ